MSQSAARLFGRCRGIAIAVLACLAVAPVSGYAQANGQLQNHHIRVGQGDAALIVSPMGETMLIDSGPESASACASSTGIITYLTSIGLTHLDYHVASHYDADHIGCTDHIAARWPIQKAAFDRGTSNVPSTLEYAEYANAVASKRQTVFVGLQFVLDQSSSAPVTFRVMAVNGNGFSVSNENDRGIVLLMRFGLLDAELGGDISSTMENRLAAIIGRVELHKVHHHGSATSSSLSFLSTISPRVAVLSVGSPNAYDHPTESALNNLRAAGAFTFWTTPGDGAPPQSGTDFVANGAVVIRMSPGVRTFDVQAGVTTTQFFTWEDPGCTFSVSPPSAILPPRRSSLNISVTTQPGCRWSATSDQPWASAAAEI